MKLWLKLLLGVTLGFAGGFASGFLAHKKLNDIQFEEVGEEDLDKLLEALPVKDVQKPTEGGGKAEKALPGPNKAIDEAETNPDKIRMAAQRKTPYIRADDAKKQEYSKIWGTVKSYSDEANADDFPTEDDPEEENPEESFINELAAESREEPLEPEMKTEPYEIDLKSFYEERREYDKITIDWYDEDNVTLDEREEIIPDVKGYIGCEMRELFDLPPADGDPDCRFVRNDNYGTDYEVIRHHGSYRELTMGG